MTQWNDNRTREDLEKRRQKTLREIRGKAAFTRLDPETIREIESEETPDDPAGITFETADPNEIITGYRARQYQRILVELARRKIESPRLYRPLPLALGFHKSNAPERIVWGSNRSGKTQAAEMEMVWAISGTHPYLPYPKSGGRFIIVGRDAKHNAEVIWRKMSYPGSYKIIRDLKTGEYRTPYPDEMETRKDELAPGPPLLPPRFYNRNAISWDSVKAGRIIKLPLYNGNEVLFYSGEAAPPNGLDVDGAWFDEEISNENWYPEVAMRLLDRCGRFWWSATPQLGGDQLADLHVRAEEEHSKERPDVEEYHLLLADNPYISEEQKRLAAAKMTEEERQVRIFGNFAHSARLVYPEFSTAYHCCDPFPLPDSASLYFFLDPSWKHTAGLLVCILSEDEHIYLVGELYLKDTPDHMIVRSMKEMFHGRSIQAFYIDHHYGAQTRLTGRSAEDELSRHMRDQGVRSVDSGNSFFWGDDNEEAGIAMVHDLLRLRGKGGDSRLRVFRGQLPNLEWEFKHFTYRKIQGVITNKTRDKFNHLMDSLRYAAAANLCYVKPLRRAEEKNPVVAALERKRAKKRAKNEMAGTGRMTFTRTG